MFLLAAEPEVQMGAQRVGTNLTQVTSPEADEEDDPNRLPTFVKAEPKTRKTFAAGDQVYSCGSTCWINMCLYYSGCRVHLCFSTGPRSSSRT